MKCGGEQPICQRCAARNDECIYKLFVHQSCLPPSATYGSRCSDYHFLAIRPCPTLNGLKNASRSSNSKLKNFRAHRHLFLDLFMQAFHHQVTQMDRHNSCTMPLMKPASIVVSGVWRLTTKEASRITGLPVFSIFPATEMVMRFRTFHVWEALPRIPTANDETASLATHGIKEPWKTCQKSLYDTELISSWSRIACCDV